MDLPKKDKKVARQLIDKGLQKEFSNGLDIFYTILNDWKKGSTDNSTAYHSLYGSVKEVDKHIARRYDALTGSRYFNTVAALVLDGIIPETDLEEFSLETRQQFEKYLNLWKKTFASGN